MRNLSSIGYDVYTNVVMSLFRVFSVFGLLTGPIFASEIAESVKSNAIHETNVEESAIIAEEKSSACNEANAAYRTATDDLESFKMTGIAMSVKEQVKNWETVLASYRDKVDKDRTKEECENLAREFNEITKDIVILTPSKSDPNATSITNSLKFITGMRPSVGLEYFNEKFVKDAYVNEGKIYAEERGHLATALWLSDNWAINSCGMKGSRFLLGWGLKLADTTGQVFNGMAIGFGCGFLIGGESATKSKDSDGVAPSINITINPIWHRFETLQEGFSVHEELPQGFTEVKTGHTSEGGVMLLLSYGLRP